MARLVGIPRATVRDWLSGRVPRAWSGCHVCGGPSHRFDELTPSCVYLLGLYLGDGHIVAHPRGVYRLRVFLDVRYPCVIEACEDAITAVMPHSRVHRHTRYSEHAGHRRPSWVQVSS